MSYGHGPALASAGDDDPAGEAGGCQGHPQAAGPSQSVIPPELLQRGDVLAALAARDVGVLYRALRDLGLSQRQLGRRTGQSQSEVSEILKGRQVMAYEVFERIALGLGIPRELIGLSWWGPDGVWYGPQTPTLGESGSPAADEADEMLRRHVLAYGGITMAGAPVEKLGELLDELPDPDPMPLPSQLGQGDVVRVRDLTRRLGEAAHGVASAPEVLSAAVTWATKLLDVPGADKIRRALMVAVAELHIEAGWASFDAGLYRRAMRHYAQALELATKAGDAYLQALALNYAGVATQEAGHPDEALKMLQCGQVAAWRIPRNEHRAVTVGEPPPAIEAMALEESATILAHFGDLDAAVNHLAKGRDLWTPARTDPFGDMDRPGARLELRRGRLDAAEELAAASLRRWEGGSRTSRTQTGIVLATVHVQAREPRGPAMAKTAIDDAARLGSVRTRRQLLPLAEVLECHSGDGRELARLARQLAA